ncbi:MAG: transglycosylase SLT domain-containing protein [Acidobacteria bacterium]|nr:transglycosylase SLT domain-containing protein [Acidobacteriota bacterium]
MRVTKLYLLTAPSLGLMLAATACQSARHTNSLLPAGQANAPALHVVTKPAVSYQVPTQPVIAPQTELKPDPVADLLLQVDREYQAGKASMDAGNLDAAQVCYQNASKLLLGSKWDLHSDSRLANAYIKVTAAENLRADQALQQSDASTQQKSEPAPIDEVNETIPAMDPGVKAKAEAEIKATNSDLPLMMTDQVAGYINYFSNRGKGQLERALTRSGRYDQMIRRILREEGVPQDLIYLAQAESGFHPLAVSRAGARGIWQFMAARGRGYGLHRSVWIDERQDPEKATRAAARHLKDLYHQFGDWYLAMAAYNSGPGNVQQAVKRTGYADFWELYQRNVLPKETRNYVPIILAVTIMAKNPAQYGLEDVVPDEPIAYETVTVNYPVDLRLVAQCVDVPVATLLEMNPSMLRWATPKDAKFELHLPVGSKEQYLESIAVIPPDMRVWWRYHSVKEGETLPALARTYRTTPQAIARANQLEGNELEAEQKLIIPIAPGKRVKGEEAQTYARRITRYNVRKGDTVQSVAENFAVSATMVRQWNRLKGNSLQGRRVLYLHLPVSPSLQGTQTASVQARQKSSKSNKTSQLASISAKPVVHHKVKAGETLFSIASSYNTTVAALERDNRGIDILRPGMILIVRGIR